VELLAGQRVRATGGTPDRGAFVVVEADDAARWCAALAGRGIVADARGPRLRLCPDVVTRDTDLVAAAVALGEIVR
jgi:kynureninase